MNEPLVQYLNNRFCGNEVLKEKCCLPFITISRETGCQSFQLASSLQKELKKSGYHQWTIVTKEDIERALLDLKLDPQQVESILNADERFHVTEILKAFEAKPYKSDKRVRGVLKQFIGSLAQNGHFIIIGRAGAMITKSLPSGLHIRLVAPLEWRIKSIMQQKSLSRIAARKYIHASDERRIKLISDFCGKMSADNFWDVVINNSKFSVEEMTHMIMPLLKKYKNQE